MINGLRGIVNGNVYYVGALRALEIIHSLVFHSHQVRATLLCRRQIEVPTGICLAVRHFVHAAGKRKQDNVIAG